MKLISFPLVLLLFGLPFTWEKPTKNETITEILYTSFDGGKGGGFFSLKITKGYALLEKGRTGAKQVFSEPTDPALWKKLSKTSLAEFDKIVSTEPSAPSDGTDVELNITTDIKTHSFLNGKYEHSKKISALIADLQQELSDIAKPANIKYPE